MTSKSARLVLTSYDEPKIDESVSNILENASRFNVEIKKEPFDQKIGQFDNEPKLWGCDSKEIIRKAMMIRGPMSDMQNLVRIQTPDGVLVELLPPYNYT